MLFLMGINLGFMLAQSCSPVTKELVSLQRTQIHGFYQKSGESPN